MAEAAETHDEKRTTGVSPSEAPEAKIEAAHGEGTQPGDQIGRAREARRHAVERRDDAEALKAQAAHQLRRADRNCAAARELRQARVLVVDDSEIFRHVAASVVSGSGGLDLVGAAASGEEAVRLHAELEPDLVLLDVHMPGIDGGETARIIRRRNPETVVVLVSGETAGLSATARSVGAAAFLDKADLTPSTLDALWLEHGFAD